MRAMTSAPPNPRGIARGVDGVWTTLRRGLALSPEFRKGLGLTLVLALVATAGRVIVPVAVQQVLDRGLSGDRTVDMSLTVQLTGLALVVVVITTIAGVLMNGRLAQATETALAGLRVRAFRHIHDLSALTLAAEHRGALVSRVTSDIDTISQFMQWGGVVLLVTTGQLLLATTLMLIYSWQLASVVLCIFVPLPFVLRAFQQRLSDAYGNVRRRVAETLSRLAESVVGAEVVRAYGVADRTDGRIAEAARGERDTRYRAAKLSAFMFSSGELFAATATAAVVGAGVLMGVDWGLTSGQLVAFLFLVTLFVGPVQVATEVLDQAQTAIAGWRRVIDVLDTVADVADPAATGQGVDIPPGPISIRFDGVSFTYPAREDEGDDEPALVDVNIEIPAQRWVAVVGETGSGKTTFAKLLTRLMDPTEGRVLISGAALPDVRFSSLRRRVVMVPQDGFLFEGSIAANVAQGHPDLAPDDIELAFLELGLSDWLDGLPRGLETPVGERGEMLSAGERQLVALARAYVANPDLLVLDEATSSVDPATEVRLQRALEGLTRGRTAIAIAHRLSTAESADEVLVFDGGRMVQRGRARDLRHQPGPYARLHRSWLDAKDTETAA